MAQKQFTGILGISLISTELLQGRFKQRKLSFKILYSQGRREE